MTTWTRARHPDAGEAIVPVDALPHMPYWEAYGEPAATQLELHTQIEQERLDDQDAAAARVAAAAEAAGDGTSVPAVLELVDGDPAAAAAALAVEQDKDEPRTTLVGPLQDITEPDPDSPAEHTATTEKE